VTPAATGLDTDRRRPDALRIPPIVGRYHETCTTLNTIHRPCSEREWQLCTQAPLPCAGAHRVLLADRPRHVSRGRGPDRGITSDSRNSLDRVQLTWRLTEVQTDIFHVNRSKQVGLGLHARARPHWSLHCMHGLLIKPPQASRRPIRRRFHPSLNLVRGIHHTSNIANSSDVFRLLGNRGASPGKLRFVRQGKRHPASAGAAGREGRAHRVTRSGRLLHSKSCIGSSQLRTSVGRSEFLQSMWQTPSAANLRSTRL